MARNELDIEDNITAHYCCIPRPITSRCSRCIRCTVHRRDESRDPNGVADSSTIDEMVMEVVSKIRDGLTLSNEVPDEVFQQLCHSVSRIIAENNRQPVSVVLKDSEAHLSSPAERSCFQSLLLLFVHLTRESNSTTGIVGLTSMFRIPELSASKQQIVEDIVQSQLVLWRRNLAFVGHSGYPHVTDVRWRVEDTLRSGTTGVNQIGGSDERGVLSVLVDLHLGTQESTTSSEPDPTANMLQFRCSEEQLQDLLHKLKQAYRTLTTPLS